MSGRNSLPRLALYLVAVAVTVVGGRAWFGPGRRAPGPIAGWDFPQLAAHLRDAGLDFRVVPTCSNGRPCRSAYFTTTGDSWEELSARALITECVAEWRGTLYVEKRHAGARSTLPAQVGDDCFLVAGPFLFFGEPGLLERVRAALAPYLKG